MFVNCPAVFSGNFPSAEPICTDATTTSLFEGIVLQQFLGNNFVKSTSEFPGGFQFQYVGHQVHSVDLTLSEEQKAYPLRHCLFPKGQPTPPASVSGTYLGIPEILLGPASVVLRPSILPRGTPAPVQVVQVHRHPVGPSLPTFRFPGHTVLPECPCPFQHLNQPAFYTGTALIYNQFANPNLNVSVTARSLPTNPTTTDANACFRMEEYRLLQEERRRRQVEEASGFTASNIGPRLGLGSGLTITNLTSGVKSSITASSCHKRKEKVSVDLFDGFEDEDFGFEKVKILPPRLNVKKLKIKPEASSESVKISATDNGKPLKQKKSAHFDFAVKTDTENGQGDAPLPPLFSCKTKTSTATQTLPTSIFSTLIKPIPPPNCFEGCEGLCEGPLDSSHSGHGLVCGVTCTKPGYYVIPSLEELDLMVDPDGKCIVNNFIIGRHTYGRIQFLTPVNVKDINIDHTVLFDTKKVVVYPDDLSKPRPGEGLNVPGEIILYHVWPVDRFTKKLIRCPKEIQKMKYEEKLVRACGKTSASAQFILYDMHRGVWKIRVEHF